MSHVSNIFHLDTQNNALFLILFAVQAVGLTGAGLDSPSLKGVKGMTGAKGGKVVVEVSGAGEEVEEEEVEVETDPNFLPRSWMPSWMLTMPRYVLGLHKRIFYSVF